MATGPWQPLATGEGATPMLKSLRAMNAQIYGSIFASAGTIGGDFTVSGNMFVSGNIELTGGGVFRTAASGIRVELTADSDVINFYDASGKVGAIGWQAFPATLTFSSETGESLRIHADEVLVLRADDRVNIQSGASTDIELNAGGNIIIGGHMLPDFDDNHDLGSATRGFRQLFMAPGAPIYLGGGTAAGITHDGSNYVVFNDESGDLYIDSRVASNSIIMRAKNAAGQIKERVRIDGNGNVKIRDLNSTALFTFYEAAAWTPAIAAHDNGAHRLEFNWQNSGTWKWRFFINNVAMLSMVPAGFYAPEVYNQTTGSAANVNVATAGFLRRSTSTEEYKRNLRDWDGDDGYSVLDFVPITFNPMQSGEGEWEVLEDRILGLSFEQAQRVFPLAAVEEAKALDWNAITTGVLYVAKDHEARLQAIEDRMADCPHCGREK